MADPLVKPPADLGAERAVLGAILNNNELIFPVVEQLHTEDFYHPKHRIFFEAMLSLSQQREPIDMITVHDRLEQQNLWEDAGGMEMLVQLTNEPYYTSNLTSYIQIVKGHALQRALIAFGDEVAGRAREGGESSQSVLESAEEALLRLAQDRTRVGLTPLQDTLQETLEYISELAMQEDSLTGLPTGFRELDQQLSGLHRSDLVLLAARPSMGKTALGLNMAYNAARFKDETGKHPYHVAVFSLEMSKRQLSQRLLSMASGIPLSRIITGDFHESEDWNQLLAGITAMKDLPVYIDDTSSITVQEMRAKCRRLKMEKGLDMVVIDYLQLMSADSRRSENRQQEITAISRGLKALAKEMDCPVLALSQLSRKAESREGARPLMSDMRESGAIEQDADVVMLLYREDYYNQDTEKPNVTEVNIAKHRNGATGTVELYFEKELTRFADLNYREDPYA